MFSAALPTEYPFARFGMNEALWMEPSTEVITKIFLAWLLPTNCTNSRITRGYVEVYLFIEVFNITIAIVSLKIHTPTSKSAGS